MSALHDGRMSRHQVVWVILGCGLVTLAACLGINAWMGSPVQWFVLVIAVLFVVVLIGSYLWVRLTPSG